MTIISLSLSPRYIIYYSTLLSFRTSRLCAPRYKLLFRYPGRTNRSRAFILSLKLSTAPSIHSSVSASLLDPPCRRCVHIPPLLDSLRSIESKIQISVEIPSSKTPGYPPPLLPRPFTIFRFLDHPLLPYSSSTPCLFSSLFHSSSPFSSSVSSAPYVVPPRFAFFLFSFYPSFFLHHAHPRSPPSRKEDRNWPFGHERPRRKAAERANYGRRERIESCGDRVIAGATVAIVRDPRECLPYITGAAGKYKGHGALPSTPLGASRPSRRSELYPG